MQEEREAKYGFGKKQQQHAGPVGEEGHYGPAAGSSSGGGGGGKRGSGSGGGGGSGGVKRSRAGIGAMPTTVCACACCGLVWVAVRGGICLAG